MKRHFIVIYPFIAIAGIVFCTWRNAIHADSGAIESYHKDESTPTRSLMQVISSHTSKILGAIMNGNHDAVISESNAVAENSKAIMKNFFPESGQVGEWFKETGKDPNNPDDIRMVKKDFEKYLTAVVDAANDIAEAAQKRNIVDTYTSLDAMVKNACFTCHETARPKWPAWPEWMQISGG